jgi:hypothetical protein
MHFRGMNIASFARSPRFPAVAFQSHAEFQSYLQEHRSRLDAREEYEASLADCGTNLTHRGTCAPCLRPAAFMSSVKEFAGLTDEPRLHNLNEQMRCNCEDRLAGRERALIHFLQAAVLTPWTHLLLFGPLSNADRRIKALVNLTTHAPRLRTPAPFTSGSSVAALEAPSANFHAVVSENYLHFVPPIRAALAEILRVLVPGGRFVFTIPFQFTAASSEFMTEDMFSFAPKAPAEFRAGPGHKLGWDLLSLLTQTGFRDATAYLYWSEELGYLGNANFIFKAVK